MNARCLLEEVERLGVSLRADGDYLEYEGPQEVITPDFLDCLGANKSSLVELLGRERRDTEGTNRRGLLIRWSEHPTWIELRDPITLEWHEVRACECLPDILKSAVRHWKGSRVEHVERGKGEQVTQPELSP